MQLVQNHLRSSYISGIFIFDRGEAFLEIEEHISLPVLYENFVLEDFLFVAKLFKKL